MGSSAVPWGEQQMSSSPATAAFMVHSKLTSEAGMASASAAAQSAKIKLQKKHQQELLAAALTPPQQRTQSQVWLGVTMGAVHQQQCNGYTAAACIISDTPVRRVLHTWHAE